MGDQVFTVAGAIGEGNLHPQDATHLYLGGGEGGAVGAHHGPGGSVVGRRFPGVGKHSQAVGIGDSRGVDRDWSPFGGGAVADHRRAGGGPQRSRGEHVAIGESQDLDTPEGVHPVVGQQAHPADPVVRDGHAAVGVAQHCVVGTGAAEYRDVHPGRSLPDLPHDAQLGGTDRPSHQPTLENVDGTGELHRAIGVEQPDAGIEIHIPVDDVIAAATLNDVGAPSAEEDISIRKAGGSPQHRGQAGDHGDAVGIEYMVGFREGIGEQAALENVVAVPAGETLHLHEAIEKIDGQVGR